MTMFLNSIKPSEGSKRPRRRVGRGIGSGLGKTCGRGHKGQKSRAGGFHKVGFEGGQMPLQRRLPKRGFKSRSQLENVAVTLTELNDIFNNGDTIDILTLFSFRILSIRAKKIKIINTGEITKALHIKQPIFITAGAKEKILKAGGSIE